MADKVFPARNLGGTADNWGREVEGELISLRKSLNTITGQASNDGRSTSGQLAVTAQQLDNLEQTVEVVQATVEILNTTVSRLDTTVTELNSRSTHSTSPANLSLIKGASSGEVGPSSRAISLPSPAGGARTAILYGSGVVAWTGSTQTGAVIGDSVTVGLEVRQEGSRIWYTNASASSLKMFSFSGQDTFSVVVPVRVPAAGSSFEIRMWVGRTSSGGDTNAGARLEGMNFTIQYGDKS